MLTWDPDFIKGRMTRRMDRIGFAPFYSSHNFDGVDATASNAANSPTGHLRASRRSDARILSCVAYVRVLYNNTRLFADHP